MVLYEALVGKNTFMAQEFKPQLSNLSIRFPKISRIISKAIEYNPHRRYETARELLSDLNVLKQSDSKQHEFSIKNSFGQKFIIPPGKYQLGRNELAPQSLYMSKKQFEFDYDGMMAQVRDIANKNRAFLNDILMSDNWMKIPNPSQIKIADVKLKLNLK